MLVNAYFEYIESEKIACYRIGTCTHNRTTFKENDCFCHVDAGELFCILKQDGDVQCRENVLTHVAEHLASLRPDVQLYESFEKVGNGYDDCAVEPDVPQSITE